MLTAQCLLAYLIVSGRCVIFSVSFCCNLLATFVCILLPMTLHYLLINMSIAFLARAEHFCFAQREVVFEPQNSYGCTVLCFLSTLNQTPVYTVRVPQIWDRCVTQLPVYILAFAGTHVTVYRET